MDFDLAVVGGGINGAGVARAAAYRGYRTVLLEKDDFAQATSSQSTKMIHGGIRYLETGDFHLVFEALRERATLLRIAPNLVKPLQIVIPIYAGSPRPAWKVRLATLLYDLLAGRRNIGRSHSLSARQIEALPGLKKEGLRGAIAYHDAQVFDARLCLETALSAREAGAVVCNYHPVEKVSFAGSGYRLEGPDLRTGRPFAFSAKAVCNATGPWAPFFERATMAHPTKAMVYDRGIHLVVPSLGLTAGLALMCDDGRLMFVLPWQGDYTLIGTTEAEHKGEDFSAVPVSDGEVSYLLDHFNRFFPARKLTRGEVLHIYSGVRPLVAGQKLALTKLSREAEIQVFSQAPGTAWLILYGGKITSYRALAEQAVKKLARHVEPPPGMPLRDTATSPLSGGGLMGEVTNPPDFLTPELQQFWKNRYGSQWVEVAALALENPDLREVVVERFGFTRADLAYMVTVEMAHTLEDITLRRTKMKYALKPAETRRLARQLRSMVDSAPPAVPAGRVAP